MNIILSILSIVYGFAVYFVGNKYGVDGFLYMHYAMIAVGSIGFIICVILSDRTKVDPAELISPFPNDKD
jgi:hypothetical protein